MGTQLNSDWTINCQQAALPLCVLQAKFSMSHNNICRMRDCPIGASHSLPTAPALLSGCFRLQHSWEAFIPHIPSQERSLVWLRSQIQRNCSESRLSVCSTKLHATPCSSSLAVKFTFYSHHLDFLLFSHIVGHWAYSHLFIDQKEGILNAYLCRCSWYLLVRSCIPVKMMSGHWTKSSNVRFFYPGSNHACVSMWNSSQNCF